MAWWGWLVAFLGISFVLLLHTVQGPRSKPIYGSEELVQLVFQSIIIIGCAMAVVAATGHPVFT